MSGYHGFALISTKQKFLSAFYKFNILYFRCLGASALREISVKSKLENTKDSENEEIFEKSEKSENESEDTLAQRIAAQRAKSDPGSSFAKKSKKSDRSVEMTKKSKSKKLSSDSVQSVINDVDALLKTNEPLTNELIEDTTKVTKDDGDSVINELDQLINS